jgi:hypothetical protein
LLVWEAYNRLEPWGDDWVQTAKLEAAIRQAAGEEVHPSELIPNEDNKQAEMSDAEVNSGFRSLAGL